VAVSADLARALARAEELVRKGWCHGADAQNASGYPVPPADPAAASFDARGAILRACSEMGFSPDEVLDAAADALADALMPSDVQRMGKLSIVAWNDTKGMTQEEVADGLRKARETLRINLAG